MSVLLCKCGNQCGVNNWDRTTRSVCHRCGRQWEYQRTIARMRRGVEGTNKV